MYYLIKNIGLFKDNTPEELEAMIKKTAFSLINYEPGQTVILQGEKLNGLLILLSGEVKGEMNDENCNIIKVEDIKAPNLIAPAFIFGNGIMPVTVTTAVRSEIIFIKRDSFIKMIQENSTILTNYLDILCSKAQFLSGRMMFLRSTNIREKFIAYLNENKDSNNVIRIDKKLHELADLFAVTRPALSRVIGDLIADGIIEKLDRNIYRLR